MCAVHGGSHASPRAGPHVALRSAPHMCGAAPRRMRRGDPVRGPLHNPSCDGARRAEQPSSGVRGPAARDVPRGARPDDRRDRAADDRRRSRRAEPHLVGRHRVPARADGGHAAVRQARATCTGARSCCRPRWSSSCVGSALCGLSQSLDELIAFRALQGLGGGGLMVSAQAAIGDVVPPRERGRYTGLFGAVFGLASVAGPLLGGFLTSNLSWRWIFYVNLPLGVVALFVLAATLPAALRARAPHDRLPRHRRCSAAGLSAIVLAASLGGTSYRVGLRDDRRAGRSPGVLLLGGLPGVRAPRARAGAAAAAAQQPRVRRHERGRLRRRLRAVRRRHLPAAVPAGRQGREPDRRRGCSCCR